VSDISLDMSFGVTLDWKEHGRKRGKLKSARNYVMNDEISHSKILGFIILVSIYRCILLSFDIAIILKKCLNIYYLIIYYITLVIPGQSEYLSTDNK
jgi:hypothetical protein